METQIAHPGATLRRELDQRGMSHAEFGRRVGVSAKHVSEIINGKTGYSPEFALAMERVLGSPKAEYWMKALAEFQVSLLR